MSIAKCPYCKNEMAESEGVYHCNKCSGTGVNFKFMEVTKQKHVIDIERQDELEDSD